MKAAATARAQVGVSASAVAKAIARRADRLAILRTERERTISYLCDRFPAERRWHETAQALRHVVVVLGSPRGGTSVVHQVLRGADDAVAPLGEHRFLFTLQGWNFPDAGIDQECIEEASVSSSTRRSLLEQIFHECWSGRLPYPTPEQRECFAWNWALRFRLQWPELDADLEWLAERTCEVLTKLARHGTAIEEQRLTAILLRSLLDAGLPLDPHLYALDRDLRASVFPDIRQTSKARRGLTVEIPPFIAFGPRRRPQSACARTLLLKASSDAYRIPTLRRLFAGWNLSWLHLTRNPLAAVNGLLDGWMYPGFWQHDLAALGMPLAGPDGVWCFDIFPGWPSHLGEPLLETCLEQWRYPHSRIRACLDPDENVVRAQFEQFLAGGTPRLVLFEHLVGALDMVGGARIASASRNPPVVNATAAPASGRWRTARPGLVSLIGRDNIAAMAARLGYEPREAPRWT